MRFTMHKLMGAAILMAASHVAAAASFSCSTAHTEQEKLICADEESSSLDSKLATLYELAIDLIKGDALKAEQRKWISGTRTQCKEIGCIRSSYRSRIHSIENELSRDAVSLDEPIAGELDSPCSPDTGNRFEISMGPGDAHGAISGTIEGWSECGNKVWDAAALDGRRVGNVAEVKFNGGWDEEDWYEAFVVAYDSKIHWRVVPHDAKSQVYVPFAVDVPLSQFHTPPH